MTSTMGPGRSPLADFPGIPEEFAQKYREAGYWIDETLQEFILARCREFSERTAVIAHSARASEASSLATVTWTYAQLEEEARRAARVLADAGAVPGDRVLLQLPNTAEYMAYMCGCFLLGVVPVFTLPKHRAMDLCQFARKTDAAAHVVCQGAEDFDYLDLYRRYAGDLRAEGLVPPVLVEVGGYTGEVDADVVVVRQSPEPLADLPAPVRNRGSERLSENVAFLQLSGGTTGISKLIPRTHADYLYSVRESDRICGVDQETVMLVALPAAHNFTMSSPGILGVLHAGGSLVFAADPSPQTSFGLIERERVTMASLVPPLLQAWIASAQRRTPDLGSLELIQVGGAKLAPSVAEKVVPILGARLQQVFGMAEGLVNYTRDSDPEEVVLTTQGRPISPEDEIVILDDDDQPVASGEAGHLLTRGPYTIRGYYLEEKANLFSFTEEGYYRTGDIVRRHPDGHLEVTGRAKDQINRAGEKIAVDEIEDIALTADGVADAVVVGIADEDVGERVGLVVMPQPGANFGSDPRSYFRTYFREQGVAEFKIPERVEIRASLPMTNVGKISRRHLRTALAKDMATTRP
ncbi:(2,3-dihydroxybenzoyl)adenylate synthase [Kocuria sp. TGY1127_2]|uniref:(2,3-dihydroxybenzoyl)adenylate synthase n=1 Tax=Kocuria sp. TGY1127_2 TaxID=2711328 RepID=UPI0015BBA80E|nr:AMP-binding protein [Kocuria sp. TGY1127_2]